MPMDRERYPKDWDAIALSVKEEAGWRCERCGKQCRRPGEPFDTHRRTLTVAHLNHTPEDCRRENLRALCAPCHLRYDAAHHAETRRIKKTRQERLDLNMSSNDIQQPTIKTKLDEGAFLPVRAHDTDAGADIRTPITFELPAGKAKYVHTGVHIETPTNCATFIKSKSGLNVYHDIISDGTIDEGFDGEIVVKLYNLGDRSHTFNRGDKITQLVVIPVLYPTYEEADEISGGERGSNGYGSTGR